MTPKTINIPAILYDQALEFCNARLQEQNKPLISVLPSGRPCHPCECPCGTACGVVVGTYRWGSKGVWEFENEGSPTEFIKYFDSKTDGSSVYLPVRVV